MAAPDLRIVRTPKRALTASAAPNQLPALTAASALVEDPESIFRTGLWGRRDDWQDEAWTYSRIVGECSYFVKFRAGSCSRVRLVASSLHPETGLPTGSIDKNDADGKRFAEIVQQAAGGQRGQAQLIKRVAEILTVAGELWIAILVRQVGPPGFKRETQQWFALTKREIERGQRGNTVAVVLPDGTKHEFNPSNGDGMFRVWNPDAEKASEPDSPLRANLASLREIVRTTKKINVADISRLIGNGILVIPSEASLPSAAAPVSADKPGDESPASAPQGVARQLTHKIVEVARVNMDGDAVNNTDARLGSAVPLVIQAPGEHLDKIRHIKFSDEMTMVAIQTRQDAIKRFAMGIDMTPEQLLGLGKETNHWSSFALADADVQLHVAPILETICQAIYDHVLVGILEREGIDSSKYALWYDTSRITADPDLSDENQAAWEGNAIRTAAYVRISGLPEDALHDISTPQGAQEWARDMVTKDPKLLPQLLPLLTPNMQALDFPDPPGALPPGRPPEPGAEDKDDRVEGGTPPDTEKRAGQHGLSRDAQLGMVGDLLVIRCLELAANKRVRTNDRAQFERLRDVPKHERHRFMDPVADAEVPHLIKGWDVGLDELAARYGLDPHHVRLVVEREARRQLTTPVVDA